MRKTSEHNRPSSTSQNIIMINCWRQLVSRDGYENLILLGRQVKLHIVFNEYVYNNTFPWKNIKNWPFVVFLDGWNPRFRLHIFACPVRHFEHWFQSSRFQHHVTWIFFRVLKNFPNKNVFTIPGQLYENPGWELIIPGILRQLF